MGLPAAVFLGLPAAWASPFVPTEDGVVLEYVPASRDASTRELREANAALAKNRHDIALAEKVARLDIAQSRQLGDPRFLGRAEAAMAPWPLAADTPPSILLLRAIVLQSNHDFATSVAALQRVVAVDPSLSQAWLTLAAVNQARAEYKEALHDCGQLAVRLAGLLTDTCTASLMGLTGHAPLALRAITISLAQNAQEARKTPAVAVWAMTAAAEIAARLGDDSAEQRFRAALAIDGSDPYLLGAWSDWLLDQNRPREVIALLRDRTRIDPLLLRLVLAEQTIGSAHTKGHIADLAARFEASRLRGDTVHRREEARFTLVLLHDPARALELARDNWTVQREPADARVLLEAADAAGHPEAADPVRDWLRANNLEDARLKALAAGRRTATSTVPMDDGSIASPHR